jgi:hypothetical protein
VGGVRVADAFFAIVDSGWTYDGTTQQTVDMTTVSFVLNLIQALEDPLAEQRLHDLVWRSLPSTEPDLDTFAFGEDAAGRALACIQTPAAKADAQNIASTHPSSAVRMDVALKLQMQTCAFYQ